MLNQNYITLLKIKHQRSKKINLNIIASLSFKGLSIITSFLLVPLTLNYLDSTKYGIWLTISSIVGWFSFFDIGLGNGLRNHLAGAFSSKNLVLAKIYISTTYAMLSIIIGIVYSLFLCIVPLIEWSSFLNISSDTARETMWVSLIVFTFFSIQFVLKIIGIVLVADQLPAYNDAFNAAGNLIALLVIWIIVNISEGNLLYISIVYSTSPVLVLLFASLYFFNGKYRAIRPSIKSIRLKYVIPLAGLGFNFFIIQISSIIIFSTDNFIITQILGPAEVTTYNIAYKYFGIPIMVFSIINTPFWSAYTEAFAKKELAWISNSLKKLLLIWLLLIITIILMLLISDWFYRLWIGSKVNIGLNLSIFMGIYAIINTWNNIFAFFINGIGKIKLQMQYSIVMMIFNIPLSIYFAKHLGMGSSGIILGTCVTLLIGSILAPIQVYKIMNNCAKGIWDK